MVSYNRATVAENVPSNATLSVTGGPGSASASLTGRAIRPPTITVLSAQCVEYNVGAGTLYAFGMQVAVADENPSSNRPSGSIASPTGASRPLDFPTNPTPGAGSATLSNINPTGGPPFTELGTWVWTVSATDALGNVGTISGSIPINATNC